jgi:hypothetical protein
MFYKFYIESTTALTIDTNQCLYGTGLPNIGYTNVIGKPTFFSADWSKTILNKPDLIVYATNSHLNSSPAQGAADAAQG